MKMIITMIVMIMLLAGCGHNILTVGKGVAIETVFNPEAYSVGLSLRNGLVVSAAVRELVELEVSEDSSASGTLTTIRFKTGEQSNGYNRERAGIIPGESGRLGEPSLPKEKQQE